MLTPIPHPDPNPSPSPNPNPNPNPKPHRLTQHVETSPVVGQSPAALSAAAAPRPRSAAELAISADEVEISADEVAARAQHSSAIERLEAIEAELLYDALVADADGSAQVRFGPGLGPRVRRLRV